MRAVVLASLLLLGAVSAHADNVDSSISLLGSSASWSAGLSSPNGSAVNHTTSGAFSDTFTFDYSGSALVTVSLNTIGILSTQDIVFTSASINGVALTINPVVTMGSTQYETASLSNALVEGEPLTLVVNGYAGVLGSLAQNISASYSGSVNVTPVTAVPEPQSWALMFAGLGVVGWVAARKRA